MAKKKKNERVIIEDIELKPQVIGYTYKKKSNIGRVIVIFAAFVLAIYYINDISVFINNLLGRNSASTIKEGANNNPNKKPNVNNNEIKETVYNEYSDTLSFESNEMIFNNFKFNSNRLTFDAQNNSETVLDYSEKKFFIETYTENKTLLERRKIDINTLNENSKVSFSLDITNPFYFIALVEKTTDDYPSITLKADEEGKSTLTCKKENDNIVYNFYDNELREIKHTNTNNSVSSEGYYQNYSAYQSKVSSLNNAPGVIATFNSSLNGFTAVITINLLEASEDVLKDKMYFRYKEIPKVVKFEMETNGYTCS